MTEFFDAQLLVRARWCMDSTLSERSNPLDSIYNDLHFLAFQLFLKKASYYSGFRTQLSDSMLNVSTPSSTSILRRIILLTFSFLSHLSSSSETNEEMTEFFNAHPKYVFSKKKSLHSQSGVTKILKTGFFESAKDVEKTNWRYNPKTIIKKRRWRRLLT